MVMISLDQDRGSKTTDEDAQEAARRHNAFLHEILTNRWLSTLVLSMHLEIEAVLTNMLHLGLPKPERLFRGKGPTFAQKVDICDSLDLLDEKDAIALRALNKIRNSFSHNMDQDLPFKELCTFLSVKGPSHYTNADGSKSISLGTIQKITEHFENEGRDELEDTVFLSTRLLLASLSVRLKSMRDCERLQMEV
jgi:hypothetical protein